MDYNEYGEVINGNNTYKTIHDKLKKKQPVIIGWTDEIGTHFNILFTFEPYKEYENLLGMGLRGWYLYVSVMSVGAFGFNSDSMKDPEYIMEKLNIKTKATAEKLTDLINGITHYEEV